LARRTRADVVELIVENGGREDPRHRRAPTQRAPQATARRRRRADAPAGRGQTRIADLIVAGREDEVLADLAAGRIDPRQLLETGELHYYGW
jgi:hypothetical protein